MSWAIKEEGYLHRRACVLVGLELKTNWHASARGDDAADRVRLRSQAGYRHLFILMRQEGLTLNHKNRFRFH